MLKAAQLFCPVKVSHLQPTAQDIDTLVVFPFLSDCINDLKLELPKYLAKADDDTAPADCVEWWKQHKEELPLWSTAASLVLLVQPSSAAAERVFSLLNNTNLQDYIELSPMLQYNRK